MATKPDRQLRRGARCHRGETCPCLTARRGPSTVPFGHGSGGTRFETRSTSTRRWQGGVTGRRRHVQPGG
jgi:hypothetical protein